MDTDNTSLFEFNKDKIINAFDLEEAYSIINSLKNNNQNPNMKEIHLLESIINNNRYKTFLNINKFCLYLDILDLIYYREDAEKIINDLEIKIDEIAQLKTLKKIIDKKPRNPENKDKFEKNLRNCPHCGKRSNIEFSENMNTYVICGFNNKGFDWRDCGRDWCLRCGKKLCKKWNIDMLFNKENRYHDGKCCKNHAIKNNEPIENYCHCYDKKIN